MTEKQMQNDFSRAAGKSDQLSAEIRKRYSGPVSDAVDCIIVSAAGKKDIYRKYIDSFPYVKHGLEKIMQLTDGSVLYHAFFSVLMVSGYPVSAAVFDGPHERCMESENHGYAWIDYIETGKKYRGNGYGKVLADRILAFSAGQGAPAVMLHAASEKLCSRYYIPSGFRRVGNRKERIMLKTAEENHYHE